MSEGSDRPPVGELVWAWRNAQTRQRAAPIGEVLEAELERAALGDTELRGEVGRLLSAHLPGALATRCTLGPLRAGRLIVYVDCPTYLYELRARWAMNLARVLRAAELPVPVRSVTFRLAASTASRRTCSR